MRELCVPGIPSAFMIVRLRMMYEQNVMYNRSKYTKACDELLEQLFFAQAYPVLAWILQTAVLHAPIQFLIRHPACFFLVYQFITLLVHRGGWTCTIMTPHILYTKHIGVAGRQ